VIDGREHAMEAVFAYFKENYFLVQILGTLVVFIIIILLIRIINRIFYSKIDDKNKYYVIQKSVSYSFYGLFLVFTILFWFDAIPNFITYFGLLSAGIAIALKDIFASMVAWAFIIIRKPFKVSERISINNHSGDVIDIRMFQFSLMELTPLSEGEQSTGRIIVIPNYYIFLYPLINYDKGFKYNWNEIAVLITFDSNWQKAKEILIAIINSYSAHLSADASKMVEEANKYYLIKYRNLTPIVYINVQPSGVQLTIRYLCEVRQRRNTINDLWEEILVAFYSAGDIHLAYPTMRIT